MGCASSRSSTVHSPLPDHHTSTPEPTAPSADACARFAALSASPEAAWVGGSTSTRGGTPLSLHVSTLTAALGSSVLAKRAITHLSRGTDFVNLGDFAFFIDGLGRDAPPRSRAQSLMVLFGARGGVLTKFSLRGTLAAVLAEKGIAVSIREVDRYVRAQQRDDAHELAQRPFRMMERASSADHTHTHTHPAARAAWSHVRLKTLVNPAYN